MLWTRAARPSTGRTQKSPFHIAVGSSPRRIGPFSSLRNTRETFMIFIPVLRLIKRRFYSKLLYKYFYIFLSWKSLQINQFIFLCPTKFFERDSIQSVISHVFSQALTSKSLNHHRVANSSRVVATQCDIDIFLSRDLGKIDIYQRHFRVNYYYCQHYLFFPRVRCEMDFTVTRVPRAGAAVGGQRPLQVQAELSTKFREYFHNIWISAFSLLIPRIYYIDTMLNRHLNMVSSPKIGTLFSKVNYQW